jgi:hypothetical protein
MTYICHVLSYTGANAQTYRQRQRGNAAKNIIRKI